MSRAVVLWPLRPTAANGSSRCSRRGRCLGSRSAHRGRSQTLAARAAALRVLGRRRVRLAGRSWCAAYAHLASQRATADRFTAQPTALDRDSCAERGGRLRSYIRLPECAAMTVEGRLVRGGCLCGGVRYEVSAPFRRANFCHCSRCQKHSGGAALAQGRVPLHPSRCCEDVICSQTSPSQVTWRRFSARGVGRACSVARGPTVLRSRSGSGPSMMTRASGLATTRLSARFRRGTPFPTTAFHATPAGRRAKLVDVSRTRRSQALLRGDAFASASRQALITLVRGQGRLRVGRRTETLGLDLLGVRWWIELRRWLCSLTAFRRQAVCRLRGCLGRLCRLPGSASRRSATRQPPDGEEPVRCIRGPRRRVGGGIAGSKPDGS